MSGKTLRWITVAASIALLGGCIVSDQITTIIIRPDGSADLIMVQSNIHSSEEGEKGAQELKRFVEEFDAHQDAEEQRIKRAGGTVVEARWLRREEPFANVLVAKLPGASALEAFCTIKEENGGTTLQSRFTASGKRRKFSAAVSLPKDEKPGEARSTIRALREAQASGLSETRFVVPGGLIVDSRGFTVAADKRSALLEPDQILEMLKEARGKVEIFLEWELTGN